MRSGPIAAAREDRHTPEKKKQELTCAERPNRRCKGRKAHAREEKERADVCGAALTPVPGKAGTRRKEKARNEEKRMKKKKKQGKKEKVAHSACGRAACGGGVSCSCGNESYSDQHAFGGGISGAWD